MFRYLKMRTCVLYFLVFCCVATLVQSISLPRARRMLDPGQGVGIDWPDCPRKVRCIAHCHHIGYHHGFCTEILTCMCYGPSKRKLHDEVKHKLQKTGMSDDDGMLD